MHPHKHDLLLLFPHLLSNIIFDLLRPLVELLFKRECGSDFVAEIVLDVAEEVLAGAALLGVGLIKRKISCFSGANIPPASQLKKVCREGKETPKAAKKDFKLNRHGEVKECCRQNFPQW